jgi:hypothetical protein
MPGKLFFGSFPLTSWTNRSCLASNATVPSKSHPVLFFSLCLLFFRLGAKTRAAAAAAKPGPKTRGAAAKAADPKAPPKGPSKKEVDLKALALRQKKEAQKRAQQAKDEGIFEFFSSFLLSLTTFIVIRQRARAMRDAQDEDDDDNALEVLDGLCDNDLDGHGNSPVPPLDEEEQSGEEDPDLDVPLEEDPDALLFKETFGGMFVLYPFDQIPC